MNLTRRTAMKTVGHGIVGIAGIGGVAAGTARAEEVTVTGSLVKHNGDPVSMGQIRFIPKGGDAQELALVADNGKFSATVESKNEYQIGYLKYPDRAKELAPVKNEVPHVDIIHSFQFEETGKNLGEIRMPEPSMVNVRILDENGDPLELDAVNLIVSADGLVKGDNYPTDPKGYVYIPEAYFTGMELAGNITLTVTVPWESGESIEYQQELFVENPMTMTITRGEGAAASTPIPTTRRRNTIVTPTQSETPPDADSGSTSPTNTESTGPSPTQEVQVQEDSDGPEQSSQRGFLSNSAAEEPDFLSNAFNLTILGFLLSVAGIFHQMIEGG